MKVVVFGRNYEPVLGIARSLKAGGFTDIDLVFFGAKSAKMIVRACNVFSHKEYLPIDTSEETVVRKLESLYKKQGVGNKSVLFLCDDYTTSFADRYRDRLKDFFLFTYVDGNEAGAISRLMDKGLQVQLAVEYGLKVAESCVAEYVDGTYVIPEGIQYPCFVKPLVSAAGKAKEYIRACKDAEELREHLNKAALNKAVKSFIVQKYLEIQEEFNLHGICDGDRIYMPAAYQRVEVAQHNKGVTIVGRVIDPDTIGHCVAAIRKLMCSLHFHGMFSIDVFSSGGEFYFNEINFRIAGTCWGATGAGANIPALWVRCLCGEVDEFPAPEVRYGALFLNDKTAYEDVMWGFRTKEEMKAWNREAEYHLMQSDTDPGPWRVFHGMMVLNDLRKRANRLLKGR